MDPRAKAKGIYGRVPYFSYAQPPLLASPPPPKPADRPDAVSADLEKELTCSICTSILLHPVTLLDCLHSYCGACAKEWFSSASPAGSSLSPAYPVSKGCPTCRQSVRAIRPSTHLAAITELFLKHNPQHARDKEEIARLAKIYSPGDRIIAERDHGGTHSRNRSLSSLSNRRAGDGWWNGWVDDVDENEEQYYAAISASLMDLIPRATPGGIASPTSSLSVHTGTSSGVTSSTSGSRRPTMLPAGSMPITGGSSSSIISSGSASGGIVSGAASNTSTVQVNCDVCRKTHIQSLVHYHCSICRNDNYNLCQECFLGGKQCRGHHELIERRYNVEKHEMEQGIFCDTASCRKNCNDMFWSCNNCTTRTGTYKYCPECVNNATCCNHDLVAFSVNPDILRSCGLAANRNSLVLSQRALAGELVQPAPVAVTTRCDLCSHPIAPSTAYFHCRACHGADWDCHTACLNLYSTRGADGVAKCLAHHPLQKLVQVQMPDPQNPTHYVRRALPNSHP
ncbi:hypothetical protein TWF696_004169 [Orbilia brochopaga]|uniref:RING-type domain-containing protein n=1 Tax=Orbilia brochopaga TaxID=3140254 RepID=A0AAV9V720_9PEZI